MQHAAEISKSGLRKSLVYLLTSALTSSVTGAADTSVRADLRISLCLKGKQAC